MKKNVYAYFHYIRKHKLSTYKKLFLSTSVVFSYLFIEWLYNQHLLILLSYDYINPKDFQLTEILGKLIASFGLNLIINSAFKTFKLSRFFIGLFIGYIGLTFLFDYAVNAFPDDFRHSSYYAMIYRQDVVNKNDKLEILKFTDDKKWYEKSLVLSQFFYVLKDEQWQEFEKKIKAPVNEKIDKLNKNRTQYYKNYKKFNDSYNKIIHNWRLYSGANSQYNNYKSFMKGDLRAKFIKKVGLPPDLSFEDFIKKSSPEYDKISNFILFEGSSEANITPIYLKDLPKEMNENDFNLYIDYEIKRITTQIAPEVKNIRGNKNSFDSLAILVIPPISICLSLFSIILNILILISKWSYVIFNLKRVNLTTYSTVIVLTFSILIFSCANLKKTLTETDVYWNNIREVNHKQYPILFSMLSIGLKLEPILCFTSEEPQLIKEFTDYFYNK